MADSHKPRDGRYIESLGFYNPMTEPSTIELNGERALYWLSQGAQPSSQVRNLMKIKGVWEQFDVPFIEGQTVGIVGFGDIGRAVAARVRRGRVVGVGGCRVPRQPAMTPRVTKQRLLHVFHDPETGTLADVHAVWR